MAGRSVKEGGVLERRSQKHEEWLAERAGDLQGLINLVGGLCKYLPWRVGEEMQAVQRELHAICQAQQLPVTMAPSQTESTRQPTLQSLMHAYQQQFDVWYPGVCAFSDLQELIDHIDDVVFEYFLEQAAKSWENLREACQQHHIDAATYSRAANSALSATKGVSPQGLGLLPPSTSQQTLAIAQTASRDWLQTSQTSSGNSLSASRLIAEQAVPSEAQDTIEGYHVQRRRFPYASQHPASPNQLAREFDALNVQSPPSYSQDSRAVHTPASIIQIPISPAKSAETLQNHKNMAIGDKAAASLADPPVSALSMASNPAGADMTEMIEDLAMMKTVLPHRLLQKIGQNISRCSQRATTAVRMPTNEIGFMLERIGLEIEFAKQAEMQALLVPLTAGIMPKWIRCGQYLQIERNAPIFTHISVVISRRHAEIFSEDDQFYVVDCGSSTGTFVNGKQLTQDRPYPLGTGDIVQFGMDYQPKMDAHGHLEEKYRCIQVLMLLGRPSRAASAVAPIVSATNSTHSIAQPHKTGAGGASNPLKLLSQKQIDRLNSKALRIPVDMPKCSLRIFAEFGDILGETAAGMAIFNYKEKHIYSAVFNNYRIGWHIALGSKLGDDLINMEGIVDHPDQFVVLRDDVYMGKILTRGSDKMILIPAHCLPELSVEPLGRSVEYSRSDDDLGVDQLNVDWTAGAGRLFPDDSKLNWIAPMCQKYFVIKCDPHYDSFHFLQRYRGDRRQISLGQGQLREFKGRWGKTRYMFEARLVIPSEHEELFLLAGLFAILLQISFS